MPSIMIVAGEASGDLHGGAVVRSLRTKLPECELFGIGGDAMRDAGMSLLHHVREMNVLGFAEIVRHYPFLRRVMNECENILRARKPDVLLLIDYPGFNLKLARIAHRLGIRTVFYISPQVWAWKASRVKKMRAVIDKMLVIFPFETEIYRRENIPVAFVGHPLLDNSEDKGTRAGSGEGRGTRAEGGLSREGFFSKNNFRSDVPLVGMFPGSRKQEIERMLPTFVAVAQSLQSKLTVQFAIAAAPTVPKSVLDAGLAGSGIPVLENQTEALQKFCDVALTKSGTSTLELAVAGTPMVVLYKTSALSYRIGMAFALIDFIAMPNIIAGKKIVPEFVQHDATPEKLSHALMELLLNESARKKMQDELHHVRETLGTTGAAERVADEVIAMLRR